MMSLGSLDARLLTRHECALKRNAWLIVSALLIAPMAWADDLRPIYVEIVEAEATAEGVPYRVRIRTPSQVMAPNEPRLSFPAGCKVTRQVATTHAHWLCADALHGREITLRFTLIEVRNPAIVKVYLASGESHKMVESAAKRSWRIPYPEAVPTVALQYTWLGTEHIFLGVDHLLFVLCLIWIAGTLRRIIITITGFTVAHSSTLVLSALELIRLPVPPIEAVIALSVLFLAAEIVHGPRDSLTWRHPLVVSTAFGLLHGLGFAAVLTEIGLPQNEVLTGLVFFNVGVEIGQVLFAIAVVACLELLRRAPLRQDFVRVTAGYAVGCMAAWWLIDSVVSLV